MPTASLIELIRPLAWLAAFAFLLGFGGYLTAVAADAARTSRIEAASAVTPPLDEVHAARL